ncbi:GFA family protein [Sphingomonas sp.]|uniref:GFA family protein n=1 Tax=Sphingomonas sp. TaxID=28214 RepID=UPI003B3BE6E4
MNGACHCGRVTVRVPGAPAYLNQCNCSVCSKLGALWGYYSRTEVTVDGAPADYVRADIDHPELEFHFCATCGSTTHYSMLDRASDRVAVNMRLIDPDELAGVEVRYGDRRNNPSGARTYYREPTIFGATGAVA